VVHSPSGFTFRFARAAAAPAAPAAPAAAALAGARLAHRAQLYDAPDATAPSHGTRTTGPPTRGGSHPRQGSRRGQPCRCGHAGRRAICAGDGCPTVPPLACPCPTSVIGITLTPSTLTINPKPQPQTVRGNPSGNASTPVHNTAAPAAEPTLSASLATLSVRPPLRPRVNSRRPL
jgi:hypothetical protein